MARSAHQAPKTHQEYHSSVAPFLIIFLTHRADGDGRRGRGGGILRHEFWMVWGLARFSRAVDGDWFNCDGAGGVAAFTPYVASSLLDEFRACPRGVRSPLARCSR